MIISKYERLEDGEETGSIEALYYSHKRYKYPGLWSP